MLVKFKVENWKSFHCLDFSMIASQKSRFNERVFVQKDYGLRLLPISAVFGGNASGKTNFFDALSFLQELVIGIGGTRNKINIKPFAFNREDREKPVSFEIEFLVDSKIYHYELVVSYDKVLFEFLAEIYNDGDLKNYFIRNEGDIQLFENYKTERLGYVGQGTQDNVLFLTNSIQQRCEEFKSIYDWFSKTLLLISPNVSFSPSPQLLDPKVWCVFDLFDIGLDEIAEVDKTVEQIIQEMQDKFNVPDDRLEQLKDFLKSTLMVSRFSGAKVETTKFSKWVAIHNTEDGSEKVQLDLEEESDGTRRFLTLLPTVNRLRNSAQPQVVFIDEIDRSMHHLLTRRLLTYYLDECSPDSKKQLIFTTHDALLMDDDFLRLDEMWLVERKDGVSQLSSISDFKTQNRRNTLKSYLQGRFGGVPNIRLV